MKIFLKFLFSILLALGFFKALGYSMYAMNLSSDLFAALGVFGAITSAYVSSLILYKLWRKP